MRAYILLALLGLTVIAGSAQADPADLSPRAISRMRSVPTGSVQADPADLSGGVMIVHAPSGITYCAGQDWCAQHDDYLGITSCEERINTIPADGYAGETLFHVIAAWDEAKLWCATESGIGADFNGLWYFTAYGPCLVNSLENSRGGAGPTPASDERWGSIKRRFK